MKKFILFFLSFCISISILFFCSRAKTQAIVGVIVPMEHAALTEIIQGLKTSLPNTKVKVMNAQGDINLQKAIIEKLARDKCDLLVPIGTGASQMTLNLAKNCKTLCLAADPSVITSDHLATALSDELSIEKSMKMLHAFFPNLSKLTLVYSSSEKVAKEIPLLEEAARINGIHLQKLMVHALSELYTISQAIASDSEGIFILKDHLVVSGIATLARQAQKRNIPLIASDEGSVLGGATLAIGVKESFIGVQGGALAKQILEGTSPQAISPQVLEGPFTLFLNTSSFANLGIDSKVFSKSAENQALLIEYIGE